MSGWIKLHRNLINWEWYTDIPAKTLFLHCVLKANHKDGSWKGQDIKRGEFITGLPSLAEQTGLTIQQTRTALRKLKSTCELTVKSTSKFSVITVNKYDEYQDTNTQVNSQSTGNQQTNQQASNIQSTTNKNVKNDKNERMKEINESFEIFWKLTKFPKRRQDTKGDLKKKYVSIVKDGTKHEDILFASDIFAEVHKGDEYAIGMRKFMVKETIEQYLNEDMSKQKEVDPYQAQEERIRNKYKNKNISNGRLS
jgi:hypothetical protein